MTSFCLRKNRKWWLRKRLICSPCWVSPHRPLRKKKSSTRASRSSLNLQVALMTKRFLNLAKASTPRRHEFNSKIRQELEDRRRDTRLSPNLKSPTMRRRSQTVARRWRMKNCGIRVNRRRIKTELNWNSRWLRNKKSKNRALASARRCSHSNWQPEMTNQMSLHHQCWEEGWTRSSTNVT